LAHILSFPGSTVLSGEAALAYQNDLAIFSDGVWLEIMPNAPSEAWRDRIDRAALKSILNSDNSPGLSLDAMGRLALKLPRNVRESVVTPTTAYCSGGYRTAYELDTEYHKLRFYGTLDINRKLALARGERLRIGNLSTEQQRALTVAIYQHQAGLHAIAPADYSKYVRSVGPAIGEPTETLPDGLPKDGAVYMTSSEQLKVRIVSETVTSRFPIGAQELGWRLRRAEDPTYDAPVTGYRLVWQKTITLHFDFTDNAAGEMTFVESERDPTGRVVKFSELPAAFKEEALKAKGESSGPIPETPEKKKA
jgi:hypothetical protein